MTYRAIQLEDAFAVAAVSFTIATEAEARALADELNAAERLSMTIGPCDVAELARLERAMEEREVVR